MNDFRLGPLFLFIMRSIVAGLAIAFIMLYVFPDWLPESIQPDFDMRNGQKGDDKSGLVSYNKAVAASAPAVVNVYATKVLKRQVHPLFQDPIFRRFFGEQGNSQQRNTNLGSGVIVRTDGYVITNAHVVAGADEILVTLIDGRQASAEIIGIDTETDLAALKITLDNLPSISVGDSSKVNVGDVVLAIGNPYDIGQTVTQGIVSATGRNRLGITSTEGFIQTDADINQGNSGGALINARGSLIGINSRILSRSGGSEGIGLAIPVNIALEIMDDLIKIGYVERGWLGIVVQVLPPGLVDENGTAQYGIMVAGINQNSPADQAGIMPGDILTNVEDIELLNPVQAIQMITQFKPGERIRLRVLRGWEEMVLTATVSQRPKF